MAIRKSQKTKNPRHTGRLYPKGPKTFTKTEITPHGVTGRMCHPSSKPPPPPVLRSGLYQPDRGLIPINLRTR
ncbi:unnamed protein product, partial [Sphenostylis stenocarpa]